MDGTYKKYNIYTLRHLEHTHFLYLFIFIITNDSSVCVCVCLFIAFGYKARLPTSYSSYLFVYFCGGLFVNEVPEIPVMLTIPQPL